MSLQNDDKKETMSILISDESDRISRILEFLTYSGVDAEKKFDEESDIYQLSVPDSQYDKATALLKIYMEQEPDEPEEEPEPELTGSYGSFVGSEEKYKDTSSSAFAFLTVGALVIVVLILCAFHILPFPLTLGEQPIMFAALALISVVFLIIGLLSLKKANAYKAHIKTEADLEKTAIDWFLKTYTAKELDHTIEASEGTLPRSEVLCLKRLSLIRDYLLREFSSLTENHADSLSEIIYQKLFEE